MSITISFPEPIEMQLRKEAEQQGASLDHYLAAIVRQSIYNKRKRLKKDTLSESELLKKINLSVSEENWATYKRLISLRQAECLTESEHRLLIKLGDKIERATATRLKYLFQLAQLRHVSLEQLIHDLGLKPKEL